jgi:hypothetical protein
MSSPSSTCHNRSLGTVSNVFLKSTKQVYNCFFKIWLVRSKCEK